MKLNVQKKTLDLTENCYLLFLVAMLFSQFLVFS